MYKLGPHLTRSTPGGADWARRAAIVKSIDDVGLLAVAPTDAIRIYRHFYQYQEVRDGADVAREVIGSLGGYRHDRLYLEMYNEWKARAEYGLADHITMMHQFADHCHAQGYKVAGFCFPTGNPGQSDWDLLKAASFANVDLIALHEYWANAGFSTWNALRYRRVHDWLGGDHPPFIITECGRDAIAGEGGEGKPGWLLQGVSAEDYANELLAYAAELEKDSYAVGGVVYTFGPWQDFAGFDAEQIAPLMPAASGPISIPEQEAPVSTFRIGNLDVIDLRATLPHGATSYEDRALGAIEQIVIHHSATPDDRSAEAIARYHVDTMEWPGIAYHFLVHQDGRIEYTQGVEVVSYGVARRNDNTLHICLVGNWTDNPPGDVQLNAARALVDNLDFALGRVYPVVGHGEIAVAGYETACPGATWPTWKARLVATAPAVVDWQARAEDAEARVLELKGIIEQARGILSI